MQQKEKIDFQPNYLVPMTKLKSSELKSIWKEDASFRQYVRKFWNFSQQNFIESLVEILIDEGAEIDHDFTGLVPGNDGVIYFNVAKTISSIEGFIAGITRIQKEYGLFTMYNGVVEKMFGTLEEDDDPEISEFGRQLSVRKPPYVVAFAELKKAWTAFKKNKQSQLEPDLFSIVCEQVEKMEHLFVSFACTSFDWITDDSSLLGTISDFVEQFKDNLYYDMMNKRFMEVIDIKKRKM